VCRSCELAEQEAKMLKQEPRLCSHCHCILPLDVPVVLFRQKMYCIQCVKHLQPPAVEEDDGNAYQ